MNTDITSSDSVIVVMAVFYLPILDDSKVVHAAFGTSHKCSIGSDLNL